MNFQLPYIPERSQKPRTQGLTMMMDKGLSISQTEAFIETASELTDFVKFGFGTAVITNKLEDKLKLYREGGIRPYFGGTLFEAFAIRGKLAEYQKLLDMYQLDLCEVSDGSMSMPHDEKLGYIRTLSNQATVLSEVGSKVKGIVIEPDKWAEMMKAELEAGSFKVIAEARESGTVGIYNSDGTVNTELINTIAAHVKTTDVLWEAPAGNQQALFIKLFGAEVNLGNIAPDTVVPLECLRLGLRGDTFFDFLPEEFQDRKPL